VQDNRVMDCIFFTARRRFLGPYSNNYFSDRSYLDETISSGFLESATRASIVREGMGRTKLYSFITQRQFL